MTEEEVKEIIREETLKTIKSKLNSSMIFTYIENLEKENKQLKEEKKKVIEYIKEKYNYILGDTLFLDHDELIDRKQILFILETLGDKE